MTTLDHLNVFGRDLKNVDVEPVFASVFKYILTKPNCSTVFCESLKSPSVSEEFLENLSSAFHLSASEKIGLGLALSDSENLDIRMCGNVSWSPTILFLFMAVKLITDAEEHWFRFKIQSSITKKVSCITEVGKMSASAQILKFCFAGKNFCMGQIMELFAHHMSIDSAELIQEILMFLNRSEGLSKHIDAFMQMLSLVQLNDEAQFILAPLLSDELRETNFFGYFI